jgi:hypothetical protein
MKRVSIAVLTLTALAGCGSSGGSPDGGGAAGGTAGGTAGGAAGAAGQDGAAGGTTGGAGSGFSSIGVLTWKENGVMRTALAPIANRYITPHLDSLSVLGGDIAARATVSFVVSTGGTLGGSYTCGVALDGGTDSAAFTYDNHEAPAETCTITVTFAAGADGLPHVMGTFEATLPGDGGTTTLTDGQFDIPVATQGG